MVTEKSGKQLGHWVLIDIETTGLNAEDDSIIDIGFLEFAGCKLIRQFSSLVYYEGKLAQFIKALTGISSKQLLSAPKWEEVLPELQQIFIEHDNPQEPVFFLAHNAQFEQSFLEKFFDVNHGQFIDTIPFLALLFPERSHLNLESFIGDFFIREKECHRGLEDSIDLLKVLLVSLSLLHQRPVIRMNLLGLFQAFNFRQHFWSHLLELTVDDLQTLANSINFDLPSCLEKIRIAKVSAENTVVNIATVHPAPSPITLSFSSACIKELLANEESMKMFYEHYSYRQSQEQMALRVGQSLKNNLHAMIQAPTGTGKTLAYLLPAALKVLEDQHPLLIATGTKTLQAQAMEKDVPSLQNLLTFHGGPSKQLKVVRLLGSSNHLCELLFRRQQEDSELVLAMKSFEERYAYVYFENIFSYHEESQREQHKQILRDDIPYSLKQIFPSIKQIEDEIKVDFRTCIGGKCPFINRCTYIRGLNQAKEANIIIGNHALMLTWPKGVPRPSRIIVDEAHRLEHEATEAFTVEVTQEGLFHLIQNLKTNVGPGSLYYLLARKQEEDKDTAPLRQFTSECVFSLEELLLNFDEFIASYFKTQVKYTSLFWNELPMVKRDGVVDNAATAIFNIFERIRNIILELFKHFYPYLSQWDKKDLDDLSLQAYTRFETFALHVEDLLQGLNLSLEQEATYLHSLKYHEQFGYKISSAPIDVGKLVFEQVITPAESVIFTSATLANINGTVGTAGVEWFLGHKYIADKRRFRTGLYLPPVFDYQNKARVYLVPDVPNLADSKFVSTVMPPIISIVKKLGGKSLLLFSARSRFEEAREILLESFQDEITLFVQGMGNNVVEQFKKAERGVLLGMESFGEGIDIPGQGLQFLFIDKFPDTRHDLIDKERRTFFDKNFGNHFLEYYLAQRVRGLHQKLGRLLRRQNDFGAAIIVDARIGTWAGKTMRQVHELMPPYELQIKKYQHAVEEALVFLSQQQNKN